MRQVTGSLLRLLWENRFNHEGCWLWKGHLKRGYGQTQIAGKSVQIHRFTYEVLLGAIPSGLQLDHLCGVRNCANPAHLEPVTPRENTLRADSPSSVNAAKAKCVRGHRLSGGNLCIDARGSRQCRICNRLRQSLADRSPYRAYSREYQRALRAAAREAGLTKREYLRRRHAETKR